MAINDKENKNQIIEKVNGFTSKDKVLMVTIMIAAVGFLGITFVSNFSSASSKEDKKNLQSQDKSRSGYSVASSSPASFDNIPDYIRQIDSTQPTQPSSVRENPRINSKSNIGNQDVGSIVNEKQLDAAAQSSNTEPNAVTQQLKAQESARAAEDSEIYLGSKKKAPQSPYEVIAGTYIPATLETGLNSELAGYASAVTRQNVFDTVTGTFLLIPKGTRIFGKYENKVAYGQRRLLISWNRLIFSDGSSISIKGMPGTDKEGYSGFHDEVDNHLANLFSGAILLSIIGAGAQLSQPQTASGVTPSPSEAMGQTFAAQTGNQLSSISGQIVKKNMDISPTINIRPGYEFNIIVNKDMILEPLTQND